MSDIMQSHLNELGIIDELSNLMSSIYSIDDLAKQIINFVQVSFGYSHVHLYTIDNLTGDLIYRAGSADRSKSMSFNGFRTNHEDKQDTVQYVFRNVSSLIVEDFRKETSLLPSAQIDNILSEMVLPLTYAGDVLGILEIQSRSPGSFNKENLKVMEAMSDFIAIALQNTNLIRLEKMKIQIVDRIIEVAGLLSTDINANQVLEYILREVLGALPVAVAAYWIMDNEYDDNEYIPELRLAAIEGISNEQFIGSDEVLIPEMILGLSIDDLVEKFGLNDEIKKWAARNLDSEHPIIRSPGIEYDPIGAILGFESNYSAISAPMRIGDSSLGFLHLIHDQPGKYGKETQVICSTIASHSAIVLENARLYENARDQAWISSVLFQAAEATQSIASLDELLETIVSILPNLINTQSCAILLWDEYIKLFVPSVAYGLTPTQFEEFENWYIAESDVPAFDELRSTHAPVILDQSMTAGAFDESLFSSFDFSTGLFVLFPMISQGEVMGAILVDFKEDNEEYAGETSLWEEKFAIIQGIANQAAVAIENIQLIQAQEEETYVSIALLQVAQAIVSSNDLEEILAAIVRITPILVGVRRSVIFLWDEDQKIYHASQAYGFSREEISDMQPIYSPGDFPLLDWIRENDRLVYYSMIKTLDPFEWAQINIADLSTSDNSSVNLKDEFHQQNLLHSTDPLLMGFPLAVKGSVLGIMLVEEVDQSSQVPSVRVREKRFEIVTGISQQAAIAIQNSMLQRDVVERERLEREMQLAREIQSTFLPDSLPMISGWDIAVRWRPARQVGGDFYDIFTLQENKLGIVIADVADKGMPAALYMTLVRTLIRAAVQDIHSPREALLRVNNLLVPDSLQGMFVTLVYAVLSIDTGELVFSNAGHNPPLSLDNISRQISEHNRNAMALGVFQDIEIQESKMNLEPGDVILFYTDGITEAFSSDEHFYGLDRLKRILIASDYNSASTLLDQVDESVVKFSEGIPQSDDVTLVAIFRNSS